MSSNDEVAELRAALARALDRIDALEAAAAGPQASAPLPSPSPPSTGGAGDRGPVGRRALLTKGLAAAGAATAGAVLLGAQPAAANNGDAVILGATNSATSPTQVSGALFSLLNLSGQSLDARGTTIGAEGTATGASGYGVVGTGATAGVRGYGASGNSTAIGVFGTATAVGVQGAAKVGVLGTTSVSAGAGVRGTSSSASAAAVAAENTANGTGLQASGKSAVVALGAKNGVIATSNSTTLANDDAAVNAEATGSYAFLGYTGNGQVFKGTSETGGGVQVTAAQFHLRLKAPEVRNAPTGDTVAHVPGDIVETTGGDLWLCTVAGSPGTWRKVGGPATAGAFHVLPAPVRIYDSRVGTLPSQGPKTKLTGNVARTLDCTHNSSGVPKGATAITFTLLLVNAYNGAGNLTVWANGAAKPASNTFVWGAGSGRYAITAISAIDANAAIQIAASASTDVVLDIVGYYR